MTVGLLMVTHNQVGQAILDTAIDVLGGCPLPVEVISVAMQDDPEILIAKANQYLKDLNQGAGVIVLTDMYGSTPSNISTQLQSDDDQVVVIAGVNLPMLVRLLNYPQLNVTQLASKALSGGREGIFPCTLNLGGQQ